MRSLEPIPPTHKRGRLAARTYGDVNETSTSIARPRPRRRTGASREENVGPIHVVDRLRRSHAGPDGRFFVARVVGLEPTASSVSGGAVVNVGTRWRWRTAGSAKDPPERPPDGGQGSALAMPCAVSRRDQAAIPTARACQTVRETTAHAGEVACGKLDAGRGSMPDGHPMRTWKWSSCGSDPRGCTISSAARTRTESTVRPSSRGVTRGAARAKARPRRYT